MVSLTIVEVFISGFGIFFLSCITCFYFFALTPAVLTTAYAYPFAIFFELFFTSWQAVSPNALLEWPIPAGETLW